MTEPSEYATRRALERQAEGNPEQVSVNVADIDSDGNPLDAIPEPEWEPTDAMVRTFVAIIGCDGSDAVHYLRALHREGLL